MLDYDGIARSLKQKSVTSESSGFPVKLARLFQSTWNFTVILKKKGKQNPLTTQEGKSYFV